MMNTYIVLLRGINVSGKNKLPMQELRDLLNKLEYKNIQTYIQSGNIILSSQKEAIAVEKEIKKAIKTQYDYDVPVICKTISDWEKAIAKNPYAQKEEKLLYFTFLSQVPESNNMLTNDAIKDQFTIIDDVVYIYCVNGYGKTKLTNNLFEKKLNVSATSRNYRTTMKLLTLAKTI